MLSKLPIQRIIPVILVYCLGCTVSTSAPKGWLPSETQALTSVFGSWIEIKYIKEGITKRLSGEFIAATDDTLYSLNNTGFNSIPMKNLISARIAFYENDNSTITTWTLLGILSSASHGVLLIGTVPLWTIFGTTSAGNMSREPIKKISNDVSLNDFRMYARFPAGLPTNFDRSKILSGETPRFSNSRGQGFIHKLRFTGKVGHSFKTGTDNTDNFGSFNTTFKRESKVGLNVDVSIKLKLSDKFYLGPEIFIQRYSYKNEYSLFSNYSNTYNKFEVNFLISSAMKLGGSSTSSTFLTNGLGLYDHDGSTFGLYTGLNYYPSNSNFLMSTRLHYLGTDDRFLLFTLSFGIKFGT